MKKSSEESLSATCVKHLARAKVCKFNVTSVTKMAGC
jgi:hypothetical protein